MTEQEAAEAVEAVLESEIAAQEESHPHDRDAQDSAADASPSTSVEAPTALKPETPPEDLVETAHAHGEYEQQLTADPVQHASVHTTLEDQPSEDEAIASAAEQNSKEHTAAIPSDELPAAAQPALARQEPSAELSYSDLTALLSTPEGDAQPVEAPSSGAEEAWPAEHSSAEDSPAPLPKADLAQTAFEQAGPRKVGGEAAEHSGAGRQPPLPQPNPPPEPHDGELQPAEETKGGASGASTAADKYSLQPEQDVSPPHSQPEDTQKPAEVAHSEPLQDPAHLTPHTGVRGVAGAAGMAEQTPGRQPTEQQQAEIREFLASQGLHNILDGQQMDMPELQGEDITDQLSPREHGSQTDANLLEVRSPALPLPWRLFLHCSRSSQCGWGGSDPV